MIERITEEEERASEAIANLAGRNGISFKPLSPSGNDIRTLEHEGLFSKTENMIARILKINNFIFCRFSKPQKAPHIFCGVIQQDSINIYMLPLDRLFV